MSLNSHFQPVTELTERVTLLIRLLILVGVFSSCLFLNDRFALAAEAIPFTPGEKLTYQITWSFIPAGRATLEVAPDDAPTVKDAAYHFIMTARTLPVIDMLYKYRERIDSYAASGIKCSLMYKKVQESSHPRDILVSFDWGEGTAQYSNYGKEKKPIAVRPGTLDPLSSLYFLRAQPLRDRFVLERWVTDGKSLSMGRASSVQKESLVIHGKRYQTIMVEPDLKDVKGVFEKSPGAKLFVWLTDDSRRIPVKVKSKVRVGSFIAELIEDESVIPASGGQEKDFTKDNIRAK